MDGVEDLYENGEESTVGPDLPGAEARALARADRRKQRTQNGKRSGKVTYEETLSFRGKYHLYRIASAFPVPGSQLVLEARAARTKSDRKAAVAEAEAAEEARLATAKEHNDVAYANLRTIRLGGGPQLRLQAISDLFDGLRRGVAPLQITNPEELETFFMLVDTENVHKLNRMLAPGFPMINGCRGNAEATALHSSCAKGHLEVIQTLLEYGADPNVVNIYGQVALHYCWDKWNEMVKRVAYPGATERLELLDKLRVIVAELLRHGADPNVEDLAQKRPLHRAASHGQVFIVIDLLTHGAYDDALDRDGKSAMDLARENGHKDTVRIMLQWTHIKSTLMTAEFRRAWRKFLHDPLALLMSSVSLPNIITELLDADNRRLANAVARGGLPDIKKDDLTSSPSTAHASVRSVLDHQLADWDERHRKAEAGRPSQHNRLADSYTVKRSIDRQKRRRGQHLQESARPISVSAQRRLRAARAVCDDEELITNDVPADYHRSRPATSSAAFYYGKPRVARTLKGRGGADAGDAGKIRRPAFTLNHSRVLPPHARLDEDQTKKKFAGKKLHHTLTAESGRSSRMVFLPADPVGVEDSFSFAHKETHQAAYERVKKTIAMRR